MNEKGSVMANIVQEWMLSDGGIAIGKEDEWTLKEVFHCQGQDIAEWTISEQEFQNAILRI